MSPRRTFPFRFSPAYAVAGLPFGVTPWTARVVVTADRLDVRFGPWLVTTPMDNVAHVEVAGPYGFLKTAGPAHLSLSDSGVTFATNAHRGTCVVLHRRVRGINPLGPPLHPNLTVTVADPDGLADVLRGAGSP